MTLNRTYISTLTTTAVVTSALLCPAAMLAQTGNPWNPYPVQQVQPAPPPVTAPAPKPKYYQEEPPAAPSAQATGPGPSRFAPADLAQRLSAPPQGPWGAPRTALPYGYQAPAMAPYSNPPPNSPAYSGQPQGYATGYPQGYNPMNAPPNLGGYGGYGPPIIGNNGWGGGPGNNFFPFGF